MGLKGIIDSVREGAVEGGAAEKVAVLGPLLAKFLENQAGSLDLTREGEFHVSRMYNFCPRREVLKFFWPKPEEDIISTEMQMVFDWGSAWHWWLQNFYFGPMGILYGKWKCSKCGKDIEGLMPRYPCSCSLSCAQRCSWPGGYGATQRDCFRCRRWGRWWYRESKVRDDVSGLRGSIDGVLILPGSGEKVLAEFKTIDGERLKLLRGPEESNVFQVSIYLELLGFNKCLLSYWSKDKKQGPPVEFLISRNPEPLKDARERIALYREVWPEKKLCRRICQSADERRAKYCLWQEECFDGDVDAKVEKERSKRHGK